jgi:hypothetical protein
MTVLTYSREDIDNVNRWRPRANEKRRRVYHYGDRPACPCGNAGHLPAHFHQDQTMSTNTKNQTNRILRYLRTGRGLTAISALTRFGCMRLAARIEEMRQEGIKVRSRTLRRNGKRFACYSL